MKHINIFLLSSFLSIMILNSCVKNDPIFDMSEVAQFSANIYFIPISPLANPGSAVECEIEYWTKGDEIKNEFLMEEIYLTDKYDINYLDKNHSFKYEYEELISEKREYSSYPFDFTNWNPDKNAYFVKPKYDIDPSYAKQSYTQSNTDIESYISLLTDEVKKGFYQELSQSLSELEAKDLLVTKHGIISLEDYNNYFNGDGDIDEIEQNYIYIYLNFIDIKELIGTKYKYVKTTGISLSYKIINGYDEESESTQRSFSVNK